MHHTSYHDRRKSLVFFDEENPRSLVSLVPEAMAQLMRQLWGSADNGPLLGLGERALIAEMRRRGKPATTTDYILRVQFWIEYNRSKTEDERNPKLNMSYVLGTAISKEAFYKFYVIDPVRLAFLICPPVNYLARLEEALNLSCEKIMEVLDRDVTGKDGELSLKFAELLMKTNRDLYHRLRGLEKFNDKEPKQAKVEEPAAVVSEVSQGDLLAEKKARLAELRAKAAAVSGGGGPVSEASVE